jgi:hypothetical protein
MTTSLVAITGNTFPVKNPEDFRTWLAQRHACWEALEWLQERDAATAWSECPRGDWLLWWAAKVGVERKVVVLAACACARLALPYVAAGELRPLKAIETAEAWYSGKASLGDVRAAYAADDASAAAAAAAYAAADAAHAAAYAADAIAYAAAASDAYAADAAAYAAAAIAYAAHAAASAASADAAAARQKTHQQCADIVREKIRFDLVIVKMI